MGLFKPKAVPEEVTPEVAALLYACPEARTYNNLKNLTKMVGKNLGAIRGYLRPEEQLHMLTFGRHYAGMDDVGVLTNLGCFAARKGRIDQERLLWPDIESVTTGHLPNGSKVIVVRTAKYRLDFRDDDPGRLRQQMAFEGEVERDVETILQMIQSLKGLKG